MKRPFECLKKLFGFPLQERSSICEDLIRAYPSSKKIYIDRWMGEHCILGKQRRSKASANKRGSFQKQLGGLRRWQWCNLRKLCNFYPHVRLETVFPALKLSQNCYINMNIPHSLHHIYRAWENILTIGQNTKARKLQKSQFPKLLVKVKCEKFESKFSLNFWNSSFQFLSWIGESWELQ